MSNHASEHNTINDEELFGDEPKLESEDDLRDEINHGLTALAPRFTSGKPLKSVDELKNHRNGVYDIMGRNIVKAQYPRYSSTEGVKRLILLMAPLNILAPKWRKSYILKDSSDHYSLGHYDFLDDKYHDSAIASEIFETYIAHHGNFMVLAQNAAGAVENMLVEIQRMKPRVDNNFDHPDFTYLTGLSETHNYIDELIDPVLENYPSKTHDPEMDKSTLAFFKHACKNAGLHAFINSGNYYIKECEDLERSVSSFLQWQREQGMSSLPKLGKEEMQIAKCIAVIHAIDRSAGGDWRMQVQNNSVPKYLARVAEYVRYLRYAKNEDNKPLSLQLLRRGGTNKALSLYPALVEISNLIYNDDIDKLSSEAARALFQRKIHGELSKYVSNIFGALSCWEGYESDINAQMMDYCISRKLKWTYRTDFIRKLLSLDYQQLQQFHQEITPVLYKECTRIDSELNRKLMG